MVTGVEIRRIWLRLRWLEDVQVDLRRIGVRSRRRRAQDREGWTGVVGKKSQMPMGIILN